MNMTIPGKVFYDLGFEKILPESTISRLAALPPIDGIRKRQEIFRRLEDGVYLDAFRKLRGGLGELTSAERRFRASEGNVERMFSLAELMRVYGECAELLSAVDRFADDVKASLIDVSGQLAELSARLERIDEFELTLHAGSFVAETDERESFIGELRRLESALGLKPTARARLDLRIGGALDAGLSELFDEAVAFDVPEGFMDAVGLLTGLVSEVDLFLNINELVVSARAKGLPVCYPELADERVFRAEEMCDITLLKEIAGGPDGGNDIRRGETAGVSNGGRRGLIASDSDESAIDETAASDGAGRSGTAGVPNGMSPGETATVSEKVRHGGDAAAMDDVKYGRTATVPYGGIPGGRVTSPDGLRQNMAAATRTGRGEAVTIKEVACDVSATVSDGVRLYETASVPNDVMSGETASALDAVTASASDVARLGEISGVSDGVQSGETASNQDDAIASAPDVVRLGEISSVSCGVKPGATSSNHDAATASAPDVARLGEISGVSDGVKPGESNHDAATASAPDVARLGETSGVSRSVKPDAIASVLNGVETSAVLSGGRPDATAANGVTRGAASIVPNDLRLDESEPFCFIVGANGGGKTSFLRAVGVNLLLFLNGAPIFARSASIYPFRSVLTHFPVVESSISTGRFDEERARADEIIESAGRDSFILFNETYSGTNEEKGSASALDAAKRLTERGAFGLFVTHFTRVAYSGFGLLRAVVGDRNERTYKIVKSEQTGSYALDILRKYGIAPEQLAERRVSDEI